MEDIITVGSAYDLPCVFKELLHLITGLELDNTVRLTVALFAEDRPTITSLSAELIRHQLQFFNPSTWWATTLHNKRPAKVQAIQNALNSWGSGAVGLMAALEWVTRCDGFGFKCRMFNGCSSIVQYKGYFKQFRCTVVGLYVHRVFTNRSDHHESFLKVAEKMIDRLSLKCQTCTNRLVDDLRCAYRVSQQPFLDLDSILR